MAVIDHLVLAVPDLAAGVDDIESRLGVRPALGGAHPGRGTHNALVGIGESYLEIIGPDPDQDEPAEGRPFGVTTDMAARLVTFAVRPGEGETLESLVEAARAAGHDPGEIAEMSRTTPDGVTLSWRLTSPSTTAGGSIPFLIDWGTTTHPVESAPSGGRLVDLTGSTPHHELANAVNQALGVGVTVVEGDDGLTGIVQTLNQTVTL